MQSPATQLATIVSDSPNPSGKPQGFIKHQKLMV